MSSPSGAASAERIARVELPLQDWVPDLDLTPPLHAWTAEGYLLVHGQATPSARPRSSLPAVRLFAPTTRPGVWAEVGSPGMRSPPPARGPAPEAGRIWLLSGESGRAWALPDPAEWRPLSRAILWPSRIALPASLPRPPGWSLRLVPAPASSRRDGALFEADVPSGLGFHLSSLSAEELRELRRGETDGWWWLYGTQGLAEDFPARGRPLRNLGTAIEPVLLPADRAPRPTLAARQIREVFRAGEGQGLLWWDGPSEEECAVFHRADLEIVTSDSVMSREW